MANGEETGMPWQVRAITFFGVPSAIALYLVYVLAGNVQSKIDNHITASEVLINEMRVERLQQQNILNVMRTAIQADCINNAENEIARNRCLGWEPLVR